MCELEKTFKVWKEKEQREEEDFLCGRHKETRDLKYCRKGIDNWWECHGKLTYGGWQNALVLFSFQSRS